MFLDPHFLKWIPKQKSCTTKKVTFFLKVFSSPFLTKLWWIWVSSSYKRLWSKLRSHRVAQATCIHLWYAGWDQDRSPVAFFPPYIFFCTKRELAWWISKRWIGLIHWLFFWLTWFCFFFGINMFGHTSFFLFQKDHIPKTLANLNPSFLRLRDGLNKTGGPIFLAQSCPNFRDLLAPNWPYPRYILDFWNVVNRLPPKNATFSLSFFEFSKTHRFRCLEGWRVWEVFGSFLGWPGFTVETTGEWKMGVSPIGSLPFKNKHFPHHWSHGFMERRVKEKQILRGGSRMWNQHHTVDGSEIPFPTTWEGAKTL